LADTSTASVERRDLIDGLGKGLRVIEAFDDEHPRMATTEAAERAGLTRTAARRYLLSLVHFGYAETDGRQFWLLPRVLRLGQSYLAAARLPRLVQPFIQRVSMLTGETVNFSVLDGHEIVYLARSNPPRFISIGYQVGTRVPAHVVTPGYVLAGLLDDEALERWIAEHEFVGFTPKTVIEPARFRDLARRARELGYGTTVQMLDPGLCGIAVPVRNHKGEARGAIGMTVQHHAYPSEAALSALLPALREVASELRALL
jgi:IclR family pca regulon transcriptional regulator